VSGPRPTLLPRTILSRAALPLALLLLAGGGCVTVERSTRDAEIDRAAVASLEEGRTTLPDVLALLGSPLEVHQHPDGTLVVYRHQHERSFEWSIGISESARVVDLTPTSAELLGNLSYRRRSVHIGEDRLVLLFDRARVLESIGVAWGTDALPQ